MSGTKRWWLGTGRSLGLGRVKSRGEVTECLGQRSGDGEEGEDGKRHRGAAEGHTSVAGPALASRAMGTMAVRLSLAWTWRTRRERQTARCPGCAPTQIGPRRQYKRPFTRSLPPLLPQCRLPGLPPFQNGTPPTTQISRGNTCGTVGKPPQLLSPYIATVGPQLSL